MITTDLSSFVILVPPRITKAPKKVITVKEGSTATLVCKAFGFPPPVIQWSKAFSSLSQGRTTVFNGTLIISPFSLQDVGSYQCKATNKLGSATTATSLQFRKGNLSFLTRLCESAKV